MEVPTYCFSPPNRLDETIKITPTEGMIVVVEGIFALHPQLTSFVDMVKIYVDTPLDVSAVWRLIRDEKENRGRTLQQGVESYLTKVRPMFFKHIAPTQPVADLSIPSPDPIEIAKVIQFISRQQNALSLPVPPARLESPGSLGLFNHFLGESVVSNRGFCSHPIN